MLKRLRKHNPDLYKSHHGDSIVEVLIAVCIISLVLASCYALSNQNVRAIQDAQEHSEATQVLKAQVELLRRAAGAVEDDNSGIFAFSDTAPGTRYFCLSGYPSVTIVQLSAMGAALPPVAEDDFSKYSGACKDMFGRYNVAVTYDKSTNHVFVLTIRWDKIGGGKNQEQLVYRLWPKTKIIAPTPSCTAEADIALVLDTSSSMADTTIFGISRLKALKQVADYFVDNSSVSASGNHVAIVNFNHKTITSTTQGLTDNIPALHTGISDAVNATHWGTYYVQAMQTGLQALNGPGSRLTAPKVMVFISDGLPDDAEDSDWSSTSASVSMGYAQANLVKAQGVTLYTISISNEAVTVLQNMASSGKFAGAAYSYTDFTNIIEALADTLGC